MLSFFKRNTGHRAEAVGSSGLTGHALDAARHGIQSEIKRLGRDLDQAGRETEQAEQAARYHFKRGNNMQEEAKEKRNLCWPLQQKIDALTATVGSL